MSLEVIVDCGPLQGRSNKSASAAREYRDRFPDARSRRDFINRARSLGYRSFLCSYDPRLLRAIGRDAALYAVVPDAAQYVRDMNNYGLVMMGLRRLTQIGLGLFSLIPTGLKNAAGVLKKDFSSIVIILTEIEMIRFKKCKPRVVFLHPQMTDLFLANGNAEPLRRFAAFVRRKYGCEPGLFSNNFVRLDRLLRAENLDIRFVCTPVNARGYMMRPEAKAVEERLADSGRTVVAYDVTCGGSLDLESSVSYIRRLGLETAVVEFVDLPPRSLLDRAEGSAGG